MAITDCKFSSVNGMVILSVTDGNKWVDINVTDLASMMVKKPEAFAVNVLNPAIASLARRAA